jgi:hypothetical protein
MEIRTPYLPAPEPVNRSPNARPALASPTSGRIAVALIAAAQLAWIGWVFAQPLPDVGASGRVLSRSTLLWRALPAVVPGVTWRESILGQAASHLASPANLVDRLPIIGAALLIAAASVAIGHALLRRLDLGLAPSGRVEHLAMAYGLGAAVLGGLTLIVGRAIGLSPWPVRLALMATALGVAIGEWRTRPQPAHQLVAPPPSRGWLVALALVSGPFVVLMLLGALQPTIEFDSLEYHLQAPKEYFLAGQIPFLPHNVYAAMPSAVEMLTLLGMEVLGDWWTGALVGQMLIALFAVAAAVLVGATAVRIGDGASRAGAVAGLVYLTTPWIFRLGTTPLVEGPLAFYHAATALVVVRRAAFNAPEAGGIRAWLLTGLLAGAALACKYPALLTAVVPGLVAAGVAVAGSRSPRAVLAYALGVAILSGPWLVRNLADTGNPVYPLGYRVFGGRSWSPEREAQWSRAHGPRPVTSQAAATAALQVAGRSDWQSPLYAALVPLSLAASGRARRRVLAIGAHVAWLFAVWFFLTHRLDRFWVPALPSLAVLAGVGGEILARRGQRAGPIALGLVLAAGIAPCAVLVTTDLCGPSRWTERLDILRREVPEELNAPLARLDAVLPQGARVLLIGQASVFHLRSDVLYNTVFNPDRFEQIARGRTPAEVREALQAAGITHVYVDWSEIARYRRPGNYGFTDFETPERFEALVRDGVLKPGVPLGPSHELYAVAMAGSGSEPVLTQSAVAPTLGARGVLALRDDPGRLAESRWTEPLSR